MLKLFAKYPIQVGGTAAEAPPDVDRFVIWPQPGSLFAIGMKTSFVAGSHTDLYLQGRTTRQSEIDVFATQLAEHIGDVVYIGDYYDAGGFSRIVSVTAAAGTPAQFYTNPYWVTVRLEPAVQVGDDVQLSNTFGTVSILLDVYVVTSPGHEDSDGVTQVDLPPDFGGGEADEGVEALFQPRSERFAGEIAAKSSLIQQGDSLVTITTERVPARHLVRGVVTRIHAALEHLDEQIVGLDGFDWNIERVERQRKDGILTYEVTIFRDLPEESENGG